MSTLLTNIAFNGNVFSTVQDDDAIYIGGNFDSTLKPSDFNALNGVCINSLNSNWIKNLEFNNTVRCSIIDGNYIYFGGDFTKCQDIPCQRLVKINLTTQTVDTSFDTTSGFNNAVYTLAIDGDNLYIGGDFNTYKNKNRSKLVKLNKNTAAEVDADNTGFSTENGFNALVNALVIDGNNLYVGGGFSGYKSIGRQNIVKLDKNTAAEVDADGTGFSTTSGFNTTVSTLAIDGDNLYVGGFFTSYKGLTRQRLVKLNKNTAAEVDANDTGFSTTSGFNLTVIKLIIDGDNLYAAGNFTTYKGLTRQSIVKLNKNTAAESDTVGTGFSTDLGFSGGTVQSLAINGDDLYVGGQFTFYKYTSARYIAKINKNNGNVDATFTPGTGLSSSSNGVRTVIVHSNNLYVGGEFLHYKLTPNTQNKYLIKILKSTNEIDPTFNIGVGFNAPVRSLAIDSSGLYVGGDFTSYKNVSRFRIAKLNKNTAELDMDFNTQSSNGFNGSVHSVALDTTGVYAGGEFTAHGSTNCARIAKLNKNNATINTNFNVGTGFDNTVRSFAIDGNDLYVGGQFTTYQTSNARKYLAKLNKDTATLNTEFDTANKFNTGNIYSVAIDSTGVYVGGAFTSYDGVNRQRIAKLNKADATLNTGFNPGNGANGQVTSILLDGNDLYLGGFFTTYNISTRRYIAKIDKDTAVVNANFESGSAMNNVVYSLASDSLNVYVGGAFSKFKEEIRLGGYVAVNKSNAAILYKPQVANVVVVGSVVVGVVEVNPTTTAILVNDQPLPVNSVVKSTTGQKFIKVEGDATAFVAIEVIPPTEWGWSQEGLDAWAILQNL